MFHIWESSQKLERVLVKLCAKLKLFQFAGLFASNWNSYWFLFGAFGSKFILALKQDFLLIRSDFLPQQLPLAVKTIWKIKFYRKKHLRDLKRKCKNFSSIVSVFLQEFFQFVHKELLQLSFRSFYKYSSKESFRNISKIIFIDLLQVETC